MDFVQMQPEFFSTECLLRLLEEKRLIKREAGTRARLWVITDKGREYLRFYDEFLKIANGQMQNEIPLQVKCQGSRSLGFSTR
jgi:DNA-binding MarR family transcriptional regulator